MKIGIAFAGGGARGAAHLGILQAFEEHGIQADYYAGTSAGSIVAAMKALGNTNETCLEMVKAASNDLLDVAYWDIIKNMPNKLTKLDSVLKGEKLQKCLVDFMENQFLMNTKHGLAIISTDINTGTQIVFASEDLPNRELYKLDDRIKAYDRFTPLAIPYIVYASSAIPGVFRPLDYNKRRLVDGCVTNNLPANVLKVMGADKVIAIDLSKRNPKPAKVSGLFNILNQSIGVLIGQNQYLATNDPSIIRINPDLTDIGALEFNRAEECYEEGYKYGKQMAPYILKKLESE